MCLIISLCYLVTAGMESIRQLPIRVAARSHSAASSALSESAGDQCPPPRSRCHHLHAEDQQPERLQLLRHSSGVVVHLHITCVSPRKNLGSHAGCLLCNNPRVCPIVLSPAVSLRHVLLSFLLQTMAIATLAACYNNPRVFTGVVKIRKGQAVELMMASTNMDNLKCILAQHAHSVRLQYS